MYESTTQWCWFLCGAHSLMASIGADGGTNDGDVNMILNWLMYHLVFTRFSQFHWSPGLSNGNYNKPMGGTIGDPPVCSRARVRRAILFSRDMPLNRLTADGNTSCLA